MTKFEEEFDNNVETFDVIGNYNSICCEVDQVKEVFKDWQPHQPLPVVPKCVAELFNEYRLENIQRLFEFGIDDIKSNKMIKALMWRDKHPDTFSLAFITGKYEVEKPQLFYLKNKLTRKYLRKSKHTKDDWNEDIDRVETVNNKTKFTQQDIDAMEDLGSYEKIEVEE